MDKIHRVIIIVIDYPLFTLISFVWAIIGLFLEEDVKKKGQKRSSHLKTISDKDLSFASVVFLIQ